MPTSHPDSRAVLYEEDNYSKKKVQDLVNCLEGGTCFLLGVGRLVFPTYICLSEVDP